MSIGLGTTTVRAWCGCEEGRQCQRTTSAISINIFQDLPCAKCTSGYFGKSFSFYNNLVRSVLLFPHFTGKEIEAKRPWVTSLAGGGARILSPECLASEPQSWHLGCLCRGQRGARLTSRFKETETKIKLLDDLIWRVLFIQHSSYTKNIIHFG